MPEQFDLLTFPGDGMQKLQAAGDALRAHPGSTLLIPAGGYILNDSRARWIQTEIRAGTWGANPQPTMFSPDFPYTVGLDLQGCRDVTVTAYGARFLINGFMEPISIRGCTNTTVRGLTLDHMQKPFCRAVITGIDGEDTLLLFDAETPPTAEMSAPRGYLYDLQKRRIRPKFVKWHKADPRCMGENLWRARLGCGEEDVGCEVYFFLSLHFRPGILISHSENTALADITIHSQPGMGIVGFKSRDISIDRLQIVPAPGYHASTNTDATHFACCSGTVRIENSTFRGHGDDAVNIHNYYYAICSAHQDECTVQTETPDGTHSQEPDFPLSGYRLQLVDRNTLEPVDEYRVIASSETARCALKLDHPLPEKGSYLLANITELPRFIFRGNHVSEHLARGVLCKTHHARIENNTFSRITGTAVDIAAEAFWGEGVVTKDVIVRENTFQDCGFCGYGRVDDASAVAVTVSCATPTAVGAHKQIVIENNRVTCPADADKTLLPFAISAVDGLVLCNNECPAGPAAAIRRSTHIQTDIPKERLILS